jgi:hypothetical protein
MLSSPSLDQIQFLIQDRIAEAQHAALVQQAIAAHASSRAWPALRPRLAVALRGLACRLDPAAC